MGYCACHPWTADDERIWRIIKDRPRAKVEWQRLHDAIEDYNRFLIDNYKSGGGDYDRGDSTDRSARR